MEPLTLEEFRAEAAAFDAQVAKTPGIDHFCSSSDWILPAEAALMPRREPWLLRSDSGFAALMRAEHPRGFTYAEALEAMWGLACPLVGADAPGLVADLLDTCRQSRGDWDVLVFSGIPPDGVLFDSLCERFGRHYRIAIGPTAARHVASLEGGVDGFLGRRSKNFRRALARAERRALAAGLTFVEADPGEDADALYRRIQAIERRSWKGQAGVGIEAGGMRDFYRLMLRRLMARGGHRVLFGRIGERDVAYVLGGLWGDGYRGLQFSFDDDYAELSLGNVCQLEQIRRLASEGVRTYDLGTSGLDYKARWAETEVGTVAVLILRALL